jgi:carotenoid 1,2-hydratase
MLSNLNPKARARELARDDERFAEAVAPGGYSWWYFDALSDDGRRAFTAIFFIGSVFSPDYAKRLRRGEQAPAQDHLAVNLALYEGGRPVSWVMSEYGAGALTCADDDLAIGASHVERLPGGGLRLHIHDRTAPFMASLVGVGGGVDGTIEIEPSAPPIGGAELAISGGHKHRWRVPVPRARVKVRFRRPDFSFEGWGYHDANCGDGRLESTFSRWSWARFHPERDRTVILYSVRGRDGTARAMVVDAKDGAAQPDREARAVGPAPDGAPRPAGWGMTLPASFAVGDGRLRCQPDRLIDVAPFYVRYVGALTDGPKVLATGMGEYLDLDRFRSPALQFLLRFKTRRVG